MPEVAEKLRQLLGYSWDLLWNHLQQASAFPGFSFSPQAGKIKYFPAWKPVDGLEVNPGWFQNSRLVWVEGNSTFACPWMLLGHFRDAEQPQLLWESFSVLPCCQGLVFWEGFGVSFRAVFISSWEFSQPEFGVVQLIPAHLGYPGRILKDPEHPTPGIPGSGVRTFLELWSLGNVPKHQKSQNFSLNPT